jgi:hypothetical protein
MDDALVIISLVQGLLLPFLVSFLKGQQWGNNVKMLFSMGVSLVVSAATLLVQNDFNWEYLLTNAALIWASAQVVYKTWFQDTAVNATLSNALPWSKPQE